MDPALRLPNLLTRFLAKYPPKLYSAKYTGQSIPVTRFSDSTPPIALGPTLAESDQSESIVSELNSNPRLAIRSTSDSSLQPILPEDLDASVAEPSSPPALSPDGKPIRNPFLPWKTGRGWAGARIGLRRQADLFKMAKKYGVEELLPPSRKSTAFKEKRKLERGLRVRGTGEGQKVKGHKWERTMGALVEKRTKAMEEMPEMIRLWKQRGHGRGWKKYPR